MDACTEQDQHMTVLPAQNAGCRQGGYKGVCILQAVVEGLSG